MSGFCTECGERIASFEGLSSCPFCGTRGVPCEDKDQVLVSANWHELRILVIWAENWSREHDLGKTVASIARRLEDQHPDRALQLPLTFAGELRQIADRYPGTTTSDPNLNADIEEHVRLNEPPVEPKE